MNEVLKQIAIKAQVEHCISHIRLEEFAELIVKECIDTIVRDTANYPGEGMMAYYQGVQDAGKSIKQHFGVEE